MSPEDVREALDRMKAGDASAEVFETLVSAAEAFASMVPEYVFRSQVTGAVYATQNGMLAETMHAGRPAARMLMRYAPPLPDWPRFSAPEGEEKP